ncbi:hypothetical protein AB3S75_044942 [Citrus x aurantiifolia]
MIKASESLQLISLSWTSMEAARCICPGEGNGGISEITFQGWKYSWNYEKYAFSLKYEIYFNKGIREN